MNLWVTEQDQIQGSERERRMQPTPVRISTLRKGEKKLPLKVISMARVGRHVSED